MCTIQTWTAVHPASKKIPGYYSGFFWARLCPEASEWKCVCVCVFGGRERVKFGQIRQTYLTNLRNEVHLTPFRTRRHVRGNFAWSSFASFSPRATGGGAIFDPPPPVSARYLPKLLTDHCQIFGTLKAIKLAHSDKIKTLYFRYVDHKWRQVTSCFPCFKHK